MARLPMDHCGLRDYLLHACLAAVFAPFFAIAYEITYEILLAHPPRPSPASLLKWRNILEPAICGFLEGLAVTAVICGVLK